MTTTELVPVFTGTLQNQTVQLVNARDLHVCLQIGKDFSTWIKSRIEQYGFIEGEDYAIFAAPQIRGAGNRGKRTDYHLTLDTAKELAMVENNDQGRAVRRYFIRIEREAKPAVQPAPQPAALPPPPQQTLEQLALERLRSVKFMLYFDELGELCLFSRSRKCLSIEPDELASTIADPKSKIAREHLPAIINAAVKRLAATV